MANNEMFRLVCLDLPTEPFFQSYSKMIHRYTDLTMAMAFIESMRHIHILFIVSDRLAKEALSRLELHRHVRDVFILNRASDSLEINLDQNESLVGIFQLEDELDHAVQTRIVSMEKQALPFSVFDQTQRTSKDLANEFNTFLWYQVLFHTLRQMPADERAKEDMLRICSDYYQANPREEQIIQEYRESSNEDQAIHWYTRNTFFFKLANQALRTEDMLLVYHFRHWIKQLCSAIKCEHRKQSEDQSWTLYNGFQLHKDEFERLKKSIGSLISINSFLSTSRDIHVARIFAGEGLIEDRLVRVLLHIQANPARLQSVFFADISQISQFPEECEVLFSLGSTFRILSIDFDEDRQYWIVRLDATDDGSDRIHKYCQLANYDFQSTSSMIYFGRILSENLDQTDRAVRYFRELLKLVKQTDPDLPNIYDALGDVYGRSNEINQSIECYKTERKIQRKQGTLPTKPNEKIRVALRTKLAEEEKKTDEPNLEKASLLRELADCSNKAQAEIYLNQALHIYERLKLASPLMSACIDDLIWVCEYHEKNQKCLELCYRRLAVEEEYLPVDNQKLCETLKDIMNAGKTPDNHRRFVEFCRNKIPILTESLGENHSRVKHMQRYLKKTQDKLEDFEEEHTEWIEDLESINREDLYQCSRFYHDISMFYSRHELLNECVQYLLLELETCQNIHGYEPERIIELFLDIAKCYNRIFNYSEAFVYMEKAFQLSQSIEQIRPKIVQNIQKRIDNFVRRVARFNIELPWIPLSEADDDIF